MSEEAQDEQKTANGEQTSVKAESDGRSSDVASNSSAVAMLCMNILVTTAVILGMAVWSWTGPRVEQTEHGN